MINASVFMLKLIKSLCHNYKKKTEMKRFSILLLFSLLAFVSCKKEKDEKKTEPNGQKLKEMFENKRSEAVQTFQIDAAAGGTITASQGTEIVFQPNTFLLNGNPVTGNVDIEVIEIYDRGGMVLQNKPTTGVRPNGDEETLISGGELFIQAKQGNDVLSTAMPYHVNTANDPQGSFNNPMQVFKAGDQINDDDKWEEADEDQDAHPDFAEVGERQNGTGQWVIYYSFDTSSFGWTNLDRWYSYNGPLTTLNVSVPEPYDNTNCELFVLYDGEPKALARLDRYDAATGMFTEHFGKLPVGIDIHILMTSIIDDVLHYSIIGLTSVANGTTATMPEPQPTTEADLIDVINALP